MVPDKFNMVDMGGIDLLESQGVIVSGLYNRLVGAISTCRYQCLYNWKFDGINIAPTYVELTILAGVVKINDYVWVTQDDVVHIYSIEPPPVEPVVIPLSVSENGEYEVPSGVDGYNPVEVEVNTTTAEISITENGTYEPAQGVIGFSSVYVDVDSPSPEVNHIGIITNIDYINGVGVTLGAVEISGGKISFDGTEYSSGYEGFNIPIRDLTAGEDYEVSFSFQTISGDFFQSQYTLGAKISSTQVTSYPTSSDPDSSYTAFQRDFTEQSISLPFTASAETMYLIFALVGYSDSVNNIFHIGNLEVT